MSHAIRIPHAVRPRYVTHADLEAEAPAAPIAAHPHVSLARHQQRITARALGLQVALGHWMRRLAMIELRRALAHPRRYAGIAKRDVDLSQLSAELKRLLIMFGVRQALDASTYGAGATIIPAGIFADAIAGKDIRIKWLESLVQGASDRAGEITETTLAQAREAVRAILLRAEEAEVHPSTGEMAQQIRDTFVGGEDDRAYVFSDARASTIARTELAQAENTGIMAGYQVSGVSRIQWLAHAGSIRHGRLNGKTIDLGDTFVAPSGEDLRYPADPEADISETINCRCTFIAVRGEEK